MNEFFDTESLRRSAEQALAGVGTAVAELSRHAVVAVLVLATGWAVARLVRAITRRVLARVGADRALARLGVASPLERAGVTRPVSEMVAYLLYWLVLIVFFLLALDALELRAITNTVDRLLAYVPQIAGAAVIVMLGLILGRVARNFVASGAAFGSVDQAGRLAGLTNVAVVLTAIVLAIEQLGVNTQILASVATAVVAAFGLSMGAAFALGARSVVSHILAGHFLRQRFQTGQQIEIDGVAGVIHRVGTVDTLIEDDRGAKSIPNGMLLDLAVRHTGPTE